MKTPPNNPFGNSPQPAATPANAPADADRTIPAYSEPAIAADAGRTIPVSAPNDPQALQAAEAHVAAEWQVGDVILDLYEVRHIHEGGGMGMVYRVHHRGWNTDLAVKSPRSDYFQTGQQKENFSQECETWINLGLHPHIVSCHYVRALGGIPRVFAEYVEGGSLKDWIDSRKLYEGGPEPALKRMLDIAIQFAWGLHYAHEQEQKLIHQDVKPANVMLTPDGVAKVSDFGLAKARAAAGESSVAGAGRSILVSSGGMTPAYCSPEQAGKEPLSRRTDIWSWGLSVLEMFAGEMFWSAGQAADEALEFYVRQGPSDPAIPPMPDGGRELLKRCFQPRSEDRPRDMAEVADKLRGLYLKMTGTEHGRSEPKAVKLMGDALNNRGVSMLDLGRGDEAEKILEEALQSEPHHPEATYNLGLIRWRSCKITDDALVRQLKEVRKTHTSAWMGDYLLGLAHIERGDVESALKVFEDATRQSDAEEVKDALAQARSQLPTSARFVRAFEGHTDRVRSVTLSADGRWALSGSWDKTLRLWEVATGCCVRAFQGHTWCQGHVGHVTSVSLSTDGSWALSGSDDHTLRLWEVATGRCVRTLDEHTGRPTSVSLSADGRWALSGSWDKTLRLWEVATARCVRTFEGHTDQVCSVTLSADGGWALSGSGDDTLRLWEVATGRCVRTFKGTNFVNSVKLSADGRWAFSGNSDKTLRLWEVATGRCVRTFEGHTDQVNSVTLSADGRWALSGSDDDTLRLWEVGVGWLGPKAPLRLCAVKSTEEAMNAAGRFDAMLGEAQGALQAGRYNHGRLVLSQARAIPGHERDALALQVWNDLHQGCVRTDLRAAWCVRTFEGHTDYISSVSLSADGRWALSGSGDETLRLWEAATARCVRTFEGHTNDISSVSLSADGRWALSGSLDKTLRLWEVATGRCVRTFEGHTDQVHSISLSANGRWALSGSWDKTLRLWEVATGRCVHTFEGHTDCFCVSSVSLSADGRWALSGSWDKTLRLCEVATGCCVRTFEGHTGHVHAVNLSADGRWALSGSDDMTLRLWEVATGRCVRIFEEHTGHVSSVTLSADGRWAVSGSGDSTLRLWEVATGRSLRTFEEHTSTVHSVSLSADGRWALSGSSDNTLRLWELEWEFEEPVESPPTPFGGSLWKAMGSIFKKKPC